MRDQVFREEQHGRVGLKHGRLHGLVGAVRGREIGVACPGASEVCVYRFPSCRDLWLPVLEMEDESAERQTDDARCWLETKETQKADDEPETEPFGTGKENACGKKGRSPSDDPERRDRGEEDAQRRRKCGFAPGAREQQTPRQRQERRGG